jgi:uncharacterized RDD family membrane protein YckC
MSSVPPPPPPPGAAPQPGYPPQPSHPPQAGYAVGRYEYAGFWERVASRLIDGLIALLFFLPGLVVAIIGFTQTEDGTFDDSDELTNTGVALVIAGFALAAAGLIVFFIIWARQLGRGQAWGHRALGIRLVRKDTGQAIGGGSAFGRYLIAVVIGGAGCSLGGLLDVLWMLWDQDKQTWHDKIMNTVVIEA